MKDLTLKVYFYKSFPEKLQKTTTECVENCFGLPHFTSITFKATDRVNLKIYYLKPASITVECLDPDKIGIIMAVIFVEDLK